MTFSFHPAAEAEFYDSVDFYEEIEPGLGYDFLVEVYSAVQRVIKFPEAWPVFEDKIRRCLLKRFPFGILYSLEGDKIYILAVMHLHREPGNLKLRKKE